ncbi:amino acid permease [Lentisphaerota bacterium ZTH]|nr:amino acid permease [Lentisphaerota bacterium]WET06439.1 amino acid permease [Lentisphaerota bacterium ZTH]
MAARTEVHSELSRDLNLFHVTMMGLGMMIGAGVFLGIGNCIGIVGPGGLLLTFALNGVVALFTAMSYAELSSAIPRAGGAYNFARIGYGRQASFIAGWMEWFASSVAGAMYAMTFSLYTMRFILTTWLKLDISENTFGLIVKAAAVAAAVLFIYINYRGASETGKIGAIVTLLQTAFMFVIGGIGVIIALKDPARLANFHDFIPHGWLKLAVAMGAIYVAFEGYEVIAQAGDEVSNPKKNLPKAMLLSVLVVTLTYVLVTFATIVAVKGGPDLTVGGKQLQPWQWIGSFNEEGFRHAVGRMIPYANLLLTLAVIFSSTSALNATIYSGTRASYALGRDSMLPKAFARISGSRKTPWFALLMTGGIVICLAGFFPIKEVQAAASLTFLVLFFLVNVCVIKIRRSMSDELTYGYLMPLFPLFPVLAIICQLTLVFFMHEFSVAALVTAGVWLVLGFAVYWLYSRFHAVATADEIHILEEEAAPLEPGTARVMLAVANPANALSMVKNTYKICRQKKASLELIHMVPVPDLVPLTDADKYLHEGKEGITETILYLGGHFKVNSTLRYCRNIARGILSALREKKINMLIMGWHGRRNNGLFSVGSTVDPLLESSPCDVIIMKNCCDCEYENILVPVAGGPNSRLAFETALTLASKKTRITLFSVVNGRSFDPSTLLTIDTRLYGVKPQNVAAKSVPGHDVKQAILDEAENCDMMVIGASRKPMLSHVFHGTLPEEVAEACDKSLIMVSATRGLRSWIRRWI